MNTLTQIVNYINTSNTGCIATVCEKHVSVQVPGQCSIHGLIFTVEIIRTADRARSLVHSML